MAEGGEYRADRAVFFLFVRDMVKGEGILTINVSQCPSSHVRGAHELRVVDVAHLVGIIVGSHRRVIRGNDDLRRIQEIVQKHRKRGESSQSPGPHSASGVTSCRRHGGVRARPELQRIAELPLDKLPRFAGEAASH